MTVTSEQRAARDSTDTALQVTAAASLVLGCVAVLYWAPALFGAPQGDGISAHHHPAAYVLRVVSMAREQYRPEMLLVVPILGALFSAASLVQIPASAGTLARRHWALLLLRGVAYAKAALYIASGLLLGLALFSSVRPGYPSWTFSAVSWALNLVFIGVYLWIIHITTRALGPSQPERSPDPSWDGAERGAGE